MWKHPLERLEDRWFMSLFALSAVATLLAMGGMLHLARGFALRPDGSESTYDIIAFEFARTPAQAALILEDWGTEGLAAARTQTWADFLFILCYVSSLSAGCIWVVRRIGTQRGLWLTWCRWCAWGMLLAGICDVIENLALLQVLGGRVEPLFTQTAFWCALVKFFFVGQALICFLGGVVGIAFGLNKPADR